MIKSFNVNKKYQNIYTVGVIQHDTIIKHVTHENNVYCDISFKTIEL